MRGNICIGCISDTDPQPIMVRSKLGLYAVCSIGIIQNAKALSEELLENGCANFETMSSGRAFAMRRARSRERCLWSL